MEEVEVVLEPLSLETVGVVVLAVVEELGVVTALEQVETAVLAGLVLVVVEVAFPI